MVSNTSGSAPTICNYCEGQAFDKGRCLGCGAASWKNANVFKWIFPKQQNSAVDVSVEKTESDIGSVFIELCKSVIRLVEKLISTALTIVKYKILFLFACLLLGILTSSLTNKSAGQKSRVTVSEYGLQRPAEPRRVESVGTLNGNRFKPVAMQAPSPIKFHSGPTTEIFSVPKTEWGKHFNPAGLVPEKGFLAFYFNSSNPTQLVQPVAVKNIGVNYNGSDFRGIYSRDFGAYWVGKITTQETETIEVKADEGWNEFRVIIDGSIVHEHSRGSGPTLAKQVTVQHRMHRDADEEVVVMQEVGKKIYPKSRAGNPLVTLAPGDHLVEVELLNNWHTTEFSVRFKR